MPPLSIAEIAKQFFALQNNRLFTIKTPLSGRSELVLTEFTCEEGLGKLFETWLTLASQDPNIELKKLIGKPVTITLQLTDALASSDERYFHGYITDFEHIGTDGGLARYKAIARPWITFMDRRQDIRIFQEQTVTDILGAVLQPYQKFGDVEFRLQKPTVNRSYCIQYKETDLTFVLRLMQEEGLFFYFEHAKDAHKLIISDTSVDAKPIAGRTASLRYSTDEILDDEQVITAFAARRQLTSGSTTLKTVDYKAPAAQRQVQDDTGINQGDVENYEVYDYLGAHGFPDSSRGEQLARFRSEALAAHSKIFVGKSYCRRLTLGHYIQVEDHYDHERVQPEDRQFLLTWIRHHGTNNYQAKPGVATYTNEFRCIRKKIAFRPLQTIPHPVIHGIQTAVVVGPKGDEIYTDELGRVKVQFHWDRLGKKNQASSCWIRVAQPWASGGFGMIQLPRIGDEVVIVFGDGNPDRPLIISSVYNAQNMPPWQLPANATQSGILTRSTTGGSSDTANALRFEDKKGQEEVWLHAEKDQRIEVENDESHTVGNDRGKSIGNDENATIGRNWTLSTGGVKFETVGLASVQSVGLGKMLNVGLAYNVNVGGLYLRNVALQMASTVGLSRVDRVVQDWTAHVGHTYTVTVRGKAVGDAVKQDQANPLDISPDFNPEIPGPVQSSDSNQITITDKGQASLSGSSTAQLIGPGGTVTIDAAGIHLKGKGIYLEGPVTQSGGSAKSLAAVTEADCAECAKKTTSAHPVDVATGQKLLTHDDFVLPGRVPIRWNRRYRSADQRTGSLGIAWKLSYATEVRRMIIADTPKLVYIDFDGRQLQFPLLEVDQDHFHPIEKFTLSRLPDHDDREVYSVRFPNGTIDSYEAHPQEPDRWLLRQRETRDKQFLAFTYTQTGSLSEIRNNCHTVVARHDERGRIVEVHLADEHGNSERKLATYQYDEHGDLIKAVDRGNEVWRYQYHRHLLTRYDTPSGATFIAEWDGDTPQARCIRTYAYAPDRDGNKVVSHDTRFDYQPVTRMTRLTDGLGNVTTYRYNGLWAVDQVVQPDGNIEATEFDETGNIAARTDALGRRTETISDATGNPIAIRDAAGNLTRIEYNEQNLPIRITDPAGQIWQREYSADGLLIKEIDPLGNTSSTEYQNGLPVTRTDALGNITRTQWNDAGQLIASTDCSGHTTLYGYDELGRQTSQTNALGQTSKFYGNAAGKPTSVQPAGLGTWKTEYDAAGNARAYIDPLGQTTRVSWNAFGQQTGVVDPLGGTYAFEYDTLGRVISLTNAKGERSLLSYDVRNRISEQVGFDGRRQQYQYNSVGELAEQIDHGRDGQLRTTLLYDGLGQVIQRRLSDGTRSSFVYDSRGLLTQVRHEPAIGEPSQITYEYDAAGRRTAEVQSHHGRVWRLQHRLDPSGNRSETLLPSIGTLTWQRYGSGHIHGMLLNGEPLASFERDALHRTTQVIQGPVAQLFQFNEAGLTVAQHLLDLDEHGRSHTEPRPWRSWQYDAAGQLTHVSDAWRGERHYHYDPLTRLTGVTCQSGDTQRTAISESYRYDPAGNLLEQTRVDGTPVAVEGSASAPAAIGDRLARFIATNGISRTQLDFSYDGHGNRIERTTRDVREKTEAPPTPRLLGKLLSRSDDPVPVAAADSAATRYRYDSAHQLIGIEHADGGKTEYRYDALGRRIAKIDTPAGQTSSTTLFAWDGDWMLQEIHAGSVSRDDTLVTYIAHPDHGGPLARIAQGKRYYYMNDHLGTPQELYDDTRKVVWAVDFDAYGQAREHIASEVDNPIRFPGQFRDKESGLYYNRYRYYDPEIGRYITPDPIGLRGGGNVYAYVNGKPTQRIDPLGLNGTLGVTWGGIGQAAAAEEVLGGGPEDPIADIVAGVTIIGGAAIIGGGALYNAITGSSSQSQAKAKPATDAAPCPNDPCKQLNDEVNRAKDVVGKLGGCTPAMRGYDLTVRYNAWLGLAKARSQREQRCWNGGDQGHQQAMADAWAMVGKCKQLMTGV